MEKILLRVFLHFAGIEKRQKHEAVVAAQGVKKKVHKNIKLHT